MLQRNSRIVGSLVLMFAAVGPAAGQMGTDSRRNNVAQPAAVEPGMVTWVRSGTALGSKVIGSNGEAIGDINDLLISRRSGRIAFALVGSGGLLGIGERVVAVPFGAFTWRATEQTFGLPTTKEQLSAAPALERSEWKTLAESPRAEVSYRYFNITENSKTEEWRLRSGPSQLAVSEWPLVRATDIDGQRLVSNKGMDLGKIDELILDANSGRVGFVVVSFGGTLGFGAEHVPVPWPYFDVNSEGKLFGVDLEPESIRAAPRLASPEGPELRDPQFGTRVYSHYGLNAPWISRSASDASRQDPADIKKYNQAYSTGEERRMTGSIESLDEPSPMRGVPPVTAISLRTPADGVVIVHLAPQWFLDEQRVSLRKGDPVTLTGRWAEIDGKHCLIATNIQRADGTLVVLRRKDGDPSWTWR